jgi:hypothetical protein
MCVLCWQFLTETHWTEQMVENGPDATMATAGSDQARARRRDWHRRTQVLNHILGAYGLSLDNWHSRSYMLSDRKGNTRLVENLGALWPAAQALLGRRLDPLDPLLLQALEPRRDTRVGDV